MLKRKDLESCIFTANDAIKISKLVSADLPVITFEQDENNISEIVKFILDFLQINIKPKMKEITTKRYFIKDVDSIFYIKKILEEKHGFKVKMYHSFDLKECESYCWFDIRWW